MTEYDEQELAQIMRDGLAERAGRIDGRLGPVLKAPRRRGRWLAAAAAAVLVAGGVPVAWQELKDEGSTGQVATNPSVPSDWRAESYGGIQVVVPPTWAPGYGPMPAYTYEGGVDDPMWCTDGADQPYVGRPVRRLRRRSPVRAIG